MQNNIDKDKKLRPSILDRLIDNDPDNLVDADPARHSKLKELRAAVRRDLENLLNTRYRVVSPPEHFELVNESFINYGLPDLATINMIDGRKKKDFIKSIEFIIRTFEPRFKNVRVQFMENEDKTDRTLRFRIDALMYADPAPEEVVFDSILEPVLRTVSVEDSLHG
ncbi:MAG TPA: type VI secretion system baseplate subunit TssE [Cellvibrionaceae bacterium]|jgi:type VI secretion system protein ImpF